MNMLEYNFSNLELKQFDFGHAIPLPNFNQSHSSGAGTSSSNHFNYKEASRGSCRQKAMNGSAFQASAAVAAGKSQGKHASIFKRKEKSKREDLNKSASRKSINR